MIVAVGGHQPLQSQPQPQVWTWEENKAFESVMANCFHDAINNRWETVAAQLPGKTPAQLQERFLKVMTDVNAIKHGYPENMIIMIPVPATPLEHSPLSIPMDGGNGAYGIHGSANGYYLTVISHVRGKKRTKPTCQQQHNPTRTFTYGF
ncbi:hypothetical protein HN51_041905 [Arachis hypogaea]